MKKVFVIVSICLAFMGCKKQNPKAELQGCWYNEVIVSKSYKYYNYLIFDGDSLRSFPNRSFSNSYYHLSNDTITIEPTSRYSLYKDPAKAYIKYMNKDSLIIKVLTNKPHYFNNFEVKYKKAAFVRDTSLHIKNITFFLGGSRLFPSFFMELNKNGNVVFYGRHGYFKFEGYYVGKIDTQQYKRIEGLFQQAVSERRITIYPEYLFEAGAGFAYQIELEDNSSPIESYWTILPGYDLRYLVLYSELLMLPQVCNLEKVKGNDSAIHQMMEKIIRRRLSYLNVIGHYPYPNFIPQPVPQKLK
ncbi:MAG: hypothetical protein ACYDEQ_06265 [Desulfocucumaceae bacterium]